MNLTAARKGFKEFHPKIINCKFQKHMVKLKETLINKFPQKKLVNDDNSFLRFCNIILAALHENDPRKIKHV